MLKVMAFYHMQKNLETNMIKTYWILRQKLQNAAKTASSSSSKKILQKTAEATGNLIGNKIADKIISAGKTKSKEKRDERQEIYILSEKRQQIIDDLRCFRHSINM